MIFLRGGTKGITLILAFFLLMGGSTPLLAEEVGDGLLRDSANMSKGKLGRAVAFTCAMLLGGMHAVKVAGTMQNPIEHPYKPMPFWPSQNRRGTFEQLLRTAFKKSNGATRFQLNSAAEHNAKSVESTKHDLTVSLDEFVLNERQSDVRSPFYYDQITGYLTISGVTSFVIAQLIGSDHVIYAILNPQSDEPLSTGDLRLEE